MQDVYSETGLARQSLHIQFVRLLLKKMVKFPSIKINWNKSERLFYFVTEMNEKREITKMAEEDVDW